MVPELMVIGDYPAQDPERIWGRDEDIMFWKMMAVIGLDKDHVYVTNCIRCRLAGAPATETDSGRPCFGFVSRELRFLRPRLICTMGDLATRLVLKSREPLFRLRGRFHSCRLEDLEAVGVMPTFHPRFLRDHPEMKRAAWLDLQLIQRRLATMRKRKAP